MDAKMDSGINAEGVYTFDEAVKANLLPTELTIPQVIAIMDKMLCCEVSHRPANAVPYLTSCGFINT